MNKSGPEPKHAAKKIWRASWLRPRLALVLGSGFHYLAGEIEVEARIPFSELSGFASTGVPGHLGELLIGFLAGTPVLALNGRVHYYEGLSMAAVTFPVRVLAAYGVRHLLLTNAAGGINRRLRVGDFMILSDHINLMGTNPLRGLYGEQGEFFVDLSRCYDAMLGRLLQRAISLAGLKVRRGVYLAVTGPSYETPAEIRAFARLGADAVGMSTVPEAIVARQCGLSVAALACITNLAAGMTKTSLAHTEVLAAAARMKKSGAQVVKHFAKLYGKFVA